MLFNFRDQPKSFYKTLVLLKLKLYKIYATKIIIVFSVQNVKSKNNFHKELFLLETLIAKRIITFLLLETKITKTVFEYNDKTQ